MIALIRKIFSLRAWRKLLGLAYDSLLDGYLPTNRPVCLVDVGAHDGNFTTSLMGRWKIASAMLIEPLPAQVENLRTRFASQPFSIIHGAAGEEDGTTEINIYGFAETSSVLKIKQGLTELEGYDTTLRKAVQCPKFRLDTLTDKLPAIDLLKIDVQGSEHLVLAGAPMTLAKTSLVWIEVSFKPLYEGSSVFHEIYATLYQAGFQLRELSPGFRTQSGELVQADALFQRV